MSEKRSLAELMEEDEVVEIAKEQIPEVILKERILRKGPQKRTEPLHILNEKNLLVFVKQTNRTKKYEVKHRFYDSSVYEIDQIVEKLIKEEKLERLINGWIQLKT